MDPRESVLADFILLQSATRLEASVLKTGDDSEKKRVSGDMDFTRQKGAYKWKISHESCIIFPLY
jgi:hypothetical protein